MHEDVEIAREERAIYLIVLLACSPIVIALVMQDRSIDGGNALILILVALGVIGLGVCMRALRRGSLPRARIHRDRSRP